MTAVSLLSRLSAPAAFGQATFGADIAALTEAVASRKGPILYIARDDRTSVAAVKLAEFFAPALERVFIPGWDTLPYDRISPTATIAAKRCAGLASLAQAKPDQPIFAITTASSLVQRTPPLETFRKASFQIAIGDTITQQDLTDYLSINGYVRTPTVRDRGDFAIRGGIIDLFPPTADQPVRLDFFGDTLDQMRTFDPETQRSTGNLKRTTFAPVSEIFFTPDVLSDFRTRYLETFGPPDGDPMYEAARASIRRQGVENWLPLFHERLDSLISYLPSDCLIAFGHLAIESARERLRQAEDYFQARNEAAGESRTARVLAPGALYLREDELEAVLNSGPVARFSPQDTDAAGLGLNAQPGRNFAPERTRPDVNIFETVADHVRAKRASGDTVVLAAWSEGSAQRLGSVMADHGMGEVPRVYSAEAAAKAGLAIANLPLEAGFERDGVTLIAEQDILGDKLASPRRKRKAANFIAEAAALTQGDLIVHVDHGVGAYEGLRTLKIADAPHDCLELRYSGGDRIFLPVENIDLISRYGSEGAEGAIDKLGGVGWQTRKAKAKKRILEMAEELLKIAAARALKKAEALEETQGLYEEFAARFPYEETDEQLLCHFENTLLGFGFAGLP
ncbi:MAG: CarD family transcriptional regulator, partial [Pseudomonadota bacterium]